MADGKRQKSGSYRTTVTLSPVLYDWVSGISEQMGLPIATCINVLLNENKRSRENSKDMIELFKEMAKQNFSDMPKDFEDAARKMEDQLRLPDVK